MRGARPFFNDEEIKSMMAAIQGRYRFRDRAILALGLKTGARATQLLSLRIGDVWQSGRFVAKIQFRRRSMKGKRRGHAVPLNCKAHRPLARWLVILRRDHGGLPPAAFLFPSQKGTQALGRKAYWAILQKAATAAVLQQGISTHSSRKTVAQRVYERTGNCLVTTARALGHFSLDGTVDIRSTVRYLTFQLAEKADAALLDL